MKTQGNYATLCRKCNKVFDEKLSLCPKCGNKAYLKVYELNNGYWALTDENREELEKHCKCIFPEDVIAVKPSAICSSIGANEVIEEVRIRQEKRRQKELSKGKGKRKKKLDEQKKNHKQSK